MNPTDLLFQTFNSLFGGVTTDVTTAMVGMIALMVLIIGGSKLISVINEYSSSSKESEDDSQGSSLFSRRKDRDED